MLPRCLLCNTNHIVSAAQTIGTGAFPHPRDPNSPSVSKQLFVIFILRKVLKVPTNQLESYLRSYGNPENWIRLCLPCTLLADQAKTLYELQQNVTRKFEKAAQCIVDMVERTSLSSQLDHSFSSSVRHYITSRKFINSSDNVPPTVKVMRTNKVSLPRIRKEVGKGKRNAKQNRIIPKFQIRVLQNLPAEEEEIEMDLPVTSGNSVLSDVDMPFNNNDSVKVEVLPEDDKLDDSGSQPVLKEEEEMNIEDCFNIGGIEAPNDAVPPGPPESETTEVYGGMPIKSFTFQQKRRYRCPHCPLSYTMKWYLLQHVKNIHQNRLQCKFCSRCFMVKGSLNAHIIKEHQGKDYADRVQLVDRLVASAELKANKGKKKEKVPKGQNKFLCPLCGSEFCSNNSLKRHIFAVHEKKNYKCDLCGATYTQKYHFKKHLLTSHIEADVFKQAPNI